MDPFPSPACSCGGHGVRGPATREQSARGARELSGTPAAECLPSPGFKLMKQATLTVLPLAPYASTTLHSSAPHPARPGSTSASLRVAPPGGRYVTAGAQLHNRFISSSRRREPRGEPSCSCGSLPRTAGARGCSCGSGGLGLAAFSGMCQGTRQGALGNRVFPVGRVSVGTH